MITINSKKIVYDAPHWQLVEAEYTKAGGKTSTYTYRNSPQGAAMIVAVTETGQIVLIDQYRIPAETRVLSLPTGLIDQGETVEQAVCRELMEETGYSVASTTFLGKFLAAPAMSNLVVHLYFGHNAIKTSEAMLENAEDIQVVLCDANIIPVENEAQKYGCEYIHPMIYTAFYMAKKRGFL